MSGMIERVARAIHDALYSDEDSGAWMSGKCPLDSVTIDGDVDLKRAARAAIEAMREPMPETIDAMKINIGPLAAMWRAAIDAALVEDTHEIKQGSNN